MDNLNKLADEISHCKKCKRLIEYRESIDEKIQRSLNNGYWKRPVPGFGDKNAELLVVGLAPGAHGANRTGIPFVGDVAGDYLYRALYDYGYSNISIPETNLENLKLRNVYLTNIICCAPPEDTPSADEILNCKTYLRKELDILNNVKLILTLGKEAFKLTKECLIMEGAKYPKEKFIHGHTYNCLNGDYPIILASYHTSVRNLINHRTSAYEVDAIFKTIKSLIG